VSAAVNELARAGLVSKPSRTPFRQRTSRLSLRLDVTNVAEALEQLDAAGDR